MGILRTLIQLEVPINDLNCDEYSTDLVVTSEELRKNAIEHIKKIEKKIKKLNIKTGDCMHNRVGRDKIYRLYDLQGQKCAYEHFFNITEEDLKD